MALHEIEFTSHNGRDTIYGWIYSPTRAPRAIVQIVHGLGEHSRRYLHLIDRLLDAGFVVAAEDHAGHGRTAMQSGVWADTGPDGGVSVIEDAQTLREKATALHPGLPYVVFGHSWGSMIGRGLALAHGDGLSGLALGGIAAQIRGFDQLDNAELASRVAALPADEDPLTLAEPELMAQLFAGFVDRYGEGAGPTDWVARSADVVRDHASDPFNNFGAPMSLRFLHHFTGLYEDVNAEAFYAAIRTDLPVLVLAGDQDPVAGFGEGAYHVANRLVERGVDVETHVYSGFRHEVHNEPEIRDEVEQTIVDFVERVIA